MSVFHLSAVSLLPFVVDLPGTQDDRENPLQIPVRRFLYNVPCADDLDDDDRHNPGENEGYLLYALEVFDEFGYNKTAVKAGAFWRRCCIV